MSSKEAIEKIKNMLFGEMPVQAPAPVPQGGVRQVQRDVSVNHTIIEQMKAAQ